MQTTADRHINNSNDRPPRSERKRRRDVAQAAAVLLHLRAEHGDSAAEEAREEASRQELRACANCYERSPHRDGVCLTCGGWS